MIDLILTLLAAIQDAETRCDIPTGEAVHNSCVSLADALRTEDIAWSHEVEHEAECHASAGDPEGLLWRAVGHVGRAVSRHGVGAETLGTGYAGYADRQLASLNDAARDIKDARLMSQMIALSL